MAQKQINLKRNLNLHIAKEVLYSIAFIFSSGSILQAFLLAKGLSAGMVATYVSILSLAQTGMMVLSSLVCDKIKNIKLIMAISYFTIPLIFLGLLLTYLPSFDGNGVYKIILVSGIIVNLALGFINTFSYKFIYYIIDMKDYGKMCTIHGVINNILNISVTALTSFLINVLDYYLVMFMLFGVGFLLWLGTAVLTVMLRVKSQEQLERETTKKDHSEQTEEHTDKSVKTKEKSILINPLFYKLIPANILRGVSIGIVGQLAVIGTYQGILNTTTSVYLATIYAVASIFGALIYSRFENKYGLNKALIASGMTFAILLPFIVTFSVGILFAIYVVIGIFMRVSEVAFPVTVYRYIPFNIIGKYSCWRMMFTTLGTAIAGFVLEPLLSAIGGMGVMSIGGVCMLFACLSYVFVFRKQKSLLD